MKPSSKPASNRSKLLILSGLDPTGNAGLLRDITLAKQLNVPNLGFPTVTTLQSDTKYYDTLFFESEYFLKITSQLKNECIHSVKIGMLGNEHTVAAVIRILSHLKKKTPKLNVIWDPVLSSTSGGKLLTEKGLRLALQKLLPFITLITPNFDELKILLNVKSKYKSPPQQLCKLWSKTYSTPLYLKGGHTKHKATDYFCDGQSVEQFSGRETKQKIRGTGCAFSTAVAASLVQGKSLHAACKNAKNILQKMFDVKS